MRPYDRCVASLLVTNDFPPKVGGIQSYLHELWRRLPPEDTTLWKVIYTTGTTSEPTPVYNTTHDYHGYLHQARRVAEISGIRDTDLIANLFPLTPAPMGAFVRSATNAYAAGAALAADAVAGAAAWAVGAEASGLLMP